MISKKYNSEDYKGIAKYTRKFKKKSSAKSLAKKVGWRLFSFTKVNNVYIVKYVRDTKLARKKFAPKGTVKHGHWSNWTPDSYPEEFFN